MARMTLERMALNASVARRAGNDYLADYWTKEVERESDRLEREARAAEWNALVDNRHG
jgi:hypothetical protein